MSTTIDTAALDEQRALATAALAKVRASVRIANTFTSATVGPLFAHIGFLRRSPKARTRTLGLRFYATPDLVGERCGDGAIWESIEVVAG